MFLEHKQIVNQHGSSCCLLKTFSVEVDPFESALKASHLI
jgi:hypothetical protein